MRVFLHTKQDARSEWVNEQREFAQIPAVGEYLATSSNSEWYRVEFIVHTPFPCEFDAEVFAVQVDHLEVYKGIRFEQ